MHGVGVGTVCGTAGHSMTTRESSPSRRESHSCSSSSAYTTCRTAHGARSPQCAGGRRTVRGVHCVWPCVHDLLVRRRERDQVEGAAQPILLGAGEHGLGARLRGSHASVYPSSKGTLHSISIYARACTTLTRSPKPRAAAFSRIALAHVAEKSTHVANPTPREIDLRRAKAAPTITYALSMCVCVRVCV